MPKPAPKLQKPAPRSCGEIRYRVVRERAPGKEDGRWYWRAERYSGGTSETVWAGWATVAEADKAVAQITAGIQPGRAGDLETVGDLLAVWLAVLEDNQQAGSFAASSLVIRTQQCRRLKQEMGAIRLDRLDQRTLEAYRNRRLQTAAPRTVEGELIALRAAWRWAREAGHVENRELPVVRLKSVTRRETPPPSQATIQAALAHLSGWRRLAVLLLEGTGCRRGEIATLTWSRVNLERREIRVIGKTGARLVPISSFLAAELEGCPRQGDRVFPQVMRNLPREIGKACKAAGVPHFSPQGLRKVAVGRLLRSGVDLATEAKLLGHSIQTAFKHYYEADEEVRREAMARAGLGEAPAQPAPRPPVRLRAVRRFRRFQ